MKVLQFLQTEHTVDNTEDSINMKKVFLIRKCLITKTTCIWAFYIYKKALLSIRLQVNKNYYSTSKDKLICCVLTPPISIDTPKEGLKKSINQ